MLDLQTEILVVGSEMWRAEGFVEVNQFCSPVWTHLMIRGRLGMEGEASLRQ